MRLPASFVFVIVGWQTADLSLAQDVTPVAGDQTRRPRAASQVNAGQVDTLQVKRWIEQLSADSAEVRRAAVDGLSRVPLAPPEAVPALLRAAREELQTALELPPPSDQGTPSGRISLVGDEVSLERIKANVPDYIDRPFVLCGSVRLSDHYNYGYWNAESTHFALQFTPLGADGVRAGSERAVLYLLRQRGRRLEEQIVRLAEHGIEQAVVRVRATIVGYRHRAPESWRHMEVLDWQLLNPRTGGWGPWAYAGFDLCFAAIKNAGDDAVGPLVDLIAADPQGRGSIDGVMEAAAVRTLAEAVTEHAVELGHVSLAIHEAQSSTENLEARQRLALALASIDEAVRSAGDRQPPAATRTSLRPR